MNIRYFSSETNTEITREEAIKDLAEGIMVMVAYWAIWEDKDAVAIAVWPRHENFAREVLPKVNWSALGSVSPGEATAYAALIAEAARIAGEAI